MIKAQRVLEEKLVVRAELALAEMLEAPSPVTWTAESIKQVKPKVRWLIDERRYLNELVVQEVKFLHSFAQAALGSPGMVALLRDSATVMAGKYDGVYGMVKKRVIERQVDYDRVVQVGDDLVLRNVKIQQDLGEDEGDVAPLLEQAAVTQYRTSNFAKRIASASGATVGNARMKGAYRIIEKAFFEPAEWLEPRPRVAASADCAREALTFPNMTAMAYGLELLLEAERNEEIRIVRCKNRWRQPTGGGWADLLINFIFPDGPAAGHVAELQVVHAKLMVVRTKMGAHHEYAVFRAANELLELADRGANLPVDAEVQNDVHGQEMSETLSV